MSQFNGVLIRNMTETQLRETEEKMNEMKRDIDERRNQLEHNPRDINRFLQQFGVFHRIGDHIRYGSLQPERPKKEKIFCPQTGKYYSLNQFASTHISEQRNDRGSTVNAWTDVYCVINDEHIRMDRYYNIITQQNI